MGSMLILGGCENEAARDRADVQAAITQASRELRLLDHTHAGLAGENGSPSTQKLSAIVSELSGVSADAEQGQQAAAALLSSAARREIGEINLAAIENLDLQMRRDRQVARGIVDSILRLNTIASSFEALSTEPERQALATQKQEAEQRLAALSQQIAELDGPINELTSQNEADSAEVESLRTQAGQLLRQWSEQGSADGFDEYEQAVNFQRQADALTVQIARRQADLDFELKPEQQLVQQQINELQSLIESTDSSRRDLDTYVIETSAQGQATRQAIEMYTGRLTSTLEGIGSIYETKVAPAYEEAAQQFEQAAAAAEKAARLGRGEEAAAARLAQFRAQQSLGRLHVTIARTMQNQVSLLDRVVEAPHAFGDVSAIKTQRDAAAAIADDAGQKAQAAYTTALELSGQIGGDSAAKLQETRADLTALVASLSGQPSPSADTSSDPMSESGDAAASAPVPGAAGSEPMGAESPEALVAAVKNIQTLEDALTFALDYVRFEFDSIRQRGMVNQGRVLARNLLNLNSALEAKFNTGLTDMLQDAADASETPGASPMALDVPDLNKLNEEIGEVRVDELTETGGTLVVVNKDGEEERVPLANLNGRWFIQVTAEDLNKIGEGVEEGVSDTSEQMTSEQLDMMMAMFEPMLQQANQVISRMVTRVQGGEFASIEEFRAAAEEAFKQIMPQMPGMPGMPGTGAESANGETPNEPTNPPAE